MKNAPALLFLLASIICLSSCNSKKPPPKDEDVKAVVDSFYYNLMPNDGPPVSIGTMSIQYLTKDVAIVGLIEKTKISVARSMILVRKNDKWTLAQNQTTLIDP